MSQPSYPNAVAVAAVAKRLTHARSTEHHAFWPDSISFLDPAAIDLAHLHGPKQITDAYLLALAVANSGRLVSFDGRIDLRSVMGAEARHLVLIDNTD